MIVWTAMTLAIAAATGVQAGECQPGWEPTFGGPQGLGPSLQGGSLDSLILFDDGSGGGPALYAGGNFTQAAMLYEVNRVGKWDGTSWTPLGSGITGGALAFAYALAVFDDGSGGGPALFAGGTFTHAGGLPASNIAKWDGKGWSPVGGGVGGSVRTLQVFDDGSGGGPALYAGGSFMTAGGLPAANLARWNGTTWSAVGGGTGAPVYALTVWDDGAGEVLYVGGEFTTVGSGVSANRIAKWDGGAWSALSGGVSGTVLALTVFDDGSGDGPTLQVGGGFQFADGILARSIAKWDGDAWSNLHLGTNGSVSALKVYTDDDGTALYAGGHFTTAGGLAIDNVARWDGTAWSGPASIVNEDLTVLAFEVFDDGSSDGPVLFVVGRTLGAGSSSQAYINRWTGSDYDPLISGIDPTVRALLSHDDQQGDGPVLFVGGSFTATDDVPANRVARWDGDSWSALGAGPASPVNDLVAFDDGTGSTIYAGMDSGMARWNGSTWSNFIIGTVYSMVVFDDGSGEALYLGSSGKVLKYEGGASFTELDPIGGQVFALAVFDDGSGGGPALYAGGTFTTAGGIEVDRIAKWDGRSWSPLGIGMKTGVIYALAVYDDGGGPALYAGGDFPIAGFVLANSIAKWNGTAWSSLDGGLTDPNPNDEVRVMTVFNDGIGGGPELYVGGEFDEIGGVDADNIAHWNGTSWATLSPDNNPEPEAMVVHVGDGNKLALYVGGDFSISPGGDRNLARWQGCLPDTDLNGDGVTNGFDLAILLGQWGPCPKRGNCPADFNDDGVVNGLDLAILLANWTK